MKFVPRIHCNDDREEDHTDTGNSMVTLRGSPLNSAPFQGLPLNSSAVPDGQQEALMKLLKALNDIVEST